MRRQRGEIQTSSDVSHMPGPVTRVSGLVVAALTVFVAIVGVVSGDLAWYLLLGGVVGGFTVADLVDALRQQRYWPDFEQPELEKVPDGARPKVSGVAAEHAIRLAGKAALLPSATQLGAPPTWARLASVIYIGATIGGLRGATWAVSLAAVAAGVVLRLATPFARQSQLRIDAIRTRSARRAAGRVRGARAERSVGNTLNADSRFGYVLHAKVFASGDVDHIVVGPVLAVIETKSGGGRARLQNGQLHAGSKQFDVQLLAQVQKQASLVADISQAPAVPVLCVDKLTSSPTLLGGVWVCSQSDLCDLLVSLEETCQYGQHGTIYNRLLRAHRKSMRRRAGVAVEVAKPSFWRFRRFR